MYALTRTCVDTCSPPTMGQVITASQFQAARARARLSNKQLATLLQVSPSTISNWMRDGVVGHAQAAVEDKLGMYLRDDSPDRPLSAYSDIELLAELWQRMDTYKRSFASDEKEPTPKGEVPPAVQPSIDYGPNLVQPPEGGMKRGTGGKRPRPGDDERGE
jgi:transcriptional regulator with XRE-family HTH domain